MTYMNKVTATPRPYRQTARADAAAATHRRILEAFASRIRTGWLDEITLDEIAAASGVTVQTVIRRFGGKEGLLNAAADQLGRQIAERREGIDEGDWRAHVCSAIDDYEVSGDLVIRLLAQEQRWPPLKPVLDVGRAGHRKQVVQVYRPWLAGLTPKAKAQTIATLVLLTDVYAWQLLRRDHGLDRDATVSVTLGLVGRLIETVPSG